jgi:predicted RNA binding protein YcfA (HicA-like mRNA interferase family)
MSDWPALKAIKVYKALLAIGWQVKHQHGSHVVLVRNNFSNYVWAFHDTEEIGPRMLARIAKKTGLIPKDLK